MDEARTDDEVYDEPGEVSPETLEEAGRGERRGQMALAILVAMGLHALLPQDFKVQPFWVYPAIMGTFLILLIAGDPGIIDQERRWLKVVTDGMIALMALSNTFAVIRLIDGISNNAPYANNGEQLLIIGGIIWSTNVIAFALWYWDVDGGGSAARARRGAWADPAFVFPEMNLEQYVRSGWYPQFVDYLHLSFNTATAFSPTDVSAVKRWGKMLMVLESVTSLIVATLVIAKAINAL